MESLAACANDIKLKGISFTVWLYHEIPVCEIKLNIESASEDEMSAMKVFVKSFMKQISDLRKKYIFVFDLSVCNFLPIPQIHQVQKHLEEYYDVVKEYLIFTCMVIGNGVVKGILDIAFTIIPTTKPIVFVLHEQEQEDLTKILRKEIKAFLKNQECLEEFQN